MDLVQLFTLSLCWWTAATRSLWSDKPGLLVSSHEIEDGETVDVTCTLPIDYTGGDCRLYRGHSRTPFKVKTTTEYVCVFHLSSQELLGKHPVGTRVYLKCNYHLQQYTSVDSDIRGVTVWGSCPGPGLSVGRRFVSPDDSVEVTCSPPRGHASSCDFLRGEIYVASGSCSRNLTGKQLAIWEKPRLLLPVDLTCSYHPDRRLNIRSEPSNRNLLFVVDVSQVKSSVDCRVSVDDDQLVAFGDGGWTFVGADGPTVTIQVSNSSLTSNETCSHM